MTAIGLHDLEDRMGLFDEHELLTAGALAEIESRGHAAITLRDVQLIDLRDAWLAAEAEAGDALYAWFSGEPHERRDAYAAYVAALDREEAAAKLLASRLAIPAGVAD
jgi:hypothetical protein